MIPTKALEAITSQELSRAATVYGSVKQLRLKLSNADESALDKTFESHVQSVLDKLDSRISSLDNPRIFTIEVALARHGLFDASFQQAISLCHSISPALGECLKDLRSAHSRILADLQQCVAESVQDTAKVNSDLLALGEKLAQSESNCMNLGTTLEDLDKENEESKSLILDLKEQLRNCKVKLAKSADISASVPYSAVRTPQEKRLPVSPRFLTSPRADDKKQGKLRTGDTKDNDSASKRIPSGDGSEGWLANFRLELQRAIDENRCKEMSLRALREFLDQLYISKFAAGAKIAQGTGNTPIETMEMHLYGKLERKYGLRSIAAEQAGAVLLAVDKFATDDNFVNVFHRTFRNEIEEDFWLVQQELVKSIRDLMLVQLMSRYPTKDQATLTAMLEQKILEGVVTEDEWNDMVNYLYNNSDSTSICAMLRKLAREEMLSLGLLLEEGSASAGRADSQGPLVSSTRSPMDPKYGKHSLNSKTDMGRKLGYSSPSLKKSATLQTLKSTSSSPKINLRLSFATFQSCVLDFQLKSRLQYLASFRAAFEKVDSDYDGIVSIDQFRSCYSWLRNHSHLLDEDHSIDPCSNAATNEDEILSVLSLVDPFQSNRITFSSAAGVISRLASVTK